MKKSNVPNEGKIEIFCTHITVKGKIIYPKNGKYFHKIKLINALQVALVKVKKELKKESHLLIVNDLQVSFLNI